MITAAATLVAATMCVRDIDHSEGGFVDQTAKMVAEENCLVRIKDGIVCESSCTMWLGAKHVCVAPGATLVFHRPKNLFGLLAMPPVEFHKYARLIASHYPKSLERWYLTVVTQGGSYTIKGDELIRLGVPSCEETTND